MFFCENGVLYVKSTVYDESQWPQIEYFTLGKDWYGVINYKTSYFISILYMERCGKELKIILWKTFTTTQLKRNPSSVIKKTKHLQDLWPHLLSAVWCRVLLFVGLATLLTCPGTSNKDQVNAVPFPLMESLLTSALENDRCIPKSHLHFFFLPRCRQKATVLFEFPCVASLLKYS